MPREWTLEEIRSELSRVKKLGFVPTMRGHDTGIGHTLEGLLGLEENNYVVRDFGAFELKAHRRGSGSMLTLFTNCPSGITNRQLLEKFGYPRAADGKIVLHQTLFAAAPNAMGFSLRPDDQHRRLLLVHNDDEVGHYTYDFIQQRFTDKVGDGVVLVLAKTRGRRETEEFQYVDALLLKGFRFDRLLAKVRYDIRLGRYPDGHLHDHGSAFRFRIPDLETVFERYERLL